MLTYTLIKKTSTLGKTTSEVLCTRAPLTSVLSELAKAEAIAGENDTTRALFAARVRFTINLHDGDKR
jgi:hypothetical protein